MSLSVLTWVWSQCQAVKGNNRLALLALADEANDDGYSFPGYSTISRKINASQSCAIDCVTRLELAELILVRRPDVTGPGQHNEYLVVMDRDIPTLRARYGWPADLPAWKSPDWGARKDRGEPSQNAREAERPWRGARPSHISRTSLAPLPADPDPDPYIPEEMAESVETEPLPSVRDAKPVDNGRPPSRFSGPIHDLATALRHAGLAVRWDLDDDQARTVAARVDAYGVPTLVTLALELDAQHKGPALSARAFRRLWERIPPPCGDCDPTSRQLLGKDGTPTVRCVACHPQLRREETRTA